MCKEKKNGTRPVNHGDEHVDDDDDHDDDGNEEEEEEEEER